MCASTTRSFTTRCRPPHTPVLGQRAPASNRTDYDVRRRSFLALTALLVAACADPQPPPPPNLEGVWKTDEMRLSELYEVTVAPRGEEAVRALERVRRNHQHLRIEFTADLVSLRGAGEARVVPYRVLGSWGPLMQLEGLHQDGVVNTMIKVDGDHLTWFDADGQIEFVLIRVSTPDP